MARVQPILVIAAVVLTLSATVHGASTTTSASTNQAALHCLRPVGAPGTPLPGSYSGPPSSFKPATAPNSLLRCYGFPDRPTDPTTYRAWATAVSHAKRWVSPNPLTPQQFPSNSIQASRQATPRPICPVPEPHNTTCWIWGGLGPGTKTRPNHRYIEIFGHWTQQGGVRAKEQNVITDWVGLGGTGGPDNGDVLFPQPGTAVQLPTECFLGFILCGDPQYRLMFDELDKRISPKSVQYFLGSAIKPSSGHVIDSWTAYLPDRKRPGTTTDILYGWIDETTHQYTQYMTSYPLANLYASAAEWVVEDSSQQAANTSPPPLAPSYNCVAFTNPLYEEELAGSQETTVPLYQIPWNQLQKYWMRDTHNGDPHTIYLQPGPLSTRTAGFNVYDQGANDDTCPPFTGNVNALPATGPPGTKLILSGSGFRSHQSMTIQNVCLTQATCGHTHNPALTTTTNRNGQFAVRTTIPPDDMPGTYGFVAFTGLRSNSNLAAVRDLTDLENSVSAASSSRSSAGLAFFQVQTAPASATPTGTPRTTATPTATNSPTATPTPSDSPTETPTGTPTSTATPTETATASPVATNTPATGCNPNPPATPIGSGPAGPAVTIPPNPSGGGTWEAAYWFGTNACNGGLQDLMQGNGYEGTCADNIPQFPLTCYGPSSALDGVNYISISTNAHLNDYFLSYNVTSGTAGPTPTSIPPPTATPTSLTSPTPSATASAAVSVTPGPTTSVTPTATPVPVGG